MISIPDKNIILIGFMACGKSHLGKLLASSLKLDLIDLDAMIEAKEGHSINEIFKTSGEAYFRECEYKALKSLERCSGMVIVCGGGTPTHFPSAFLLPKLGAIFFLEASFDLIKRRLQRSKKRPLGQISTPEEIVRLYELYRLRRPLYQALGQKINVDQEDSQSVALDIAKRFAARNELHSLRHIRVEDPEDPYDLILGTGALIKLPLILAAAGLSHHKIALVTSDNIYKLLKDRLAELSLDPVIITISDGEEHKTLNNVSAIHAELFKHGFTRQSLIIAFGGGTVGDVAAFAASIYLRGVPVIQIPTTLLAMVDSSVGGKTGVDVPAGKNLIGTFYMPKAVLIDPSLLRSLPKSEYACGMAEVIKHAILGDQELFYELLQNSLSDLSLIERAVLIKVRAVTDDPHEQHRRAHLNLGHTFGHAIEKVSNYRIKHGEAVAIGLMLATRLSEHLGLLQQNFIPELKTLLERYDLPTTLPADLDKNALLQAMQHDKKRDQQGLRFILPLKIGEVSIHRVAEEMVLEIL